MITIREYVYVNSCSSIDIGTSGVASFESICDIYDLSVYAKDLDKCLHKQYKGIPPDAVTHVEEGQMLRTPLKISPWTWFRIEP